MTKSMKNSNIRTILRWPIPIASTRRVREKSAELMPLSWVSCRKISKELRAVISSLKIKSQSQTKLRIKLLWELLIDFKCPSLHLGRVGISMRTFSMTETAH